MLARENLLEDVQYQKVVPNRYIVEVNSQAYALHYQPIEREIIRQWSEKLLRHLVTTNSRIGRKEYRFGGQVQVEIRPVPDLSPSQVRVMARIDAGDDPLAATQAALPACLELIGAPDRPSGRRWSLPQAGQIVLGRSPRCEIALDFVDVQSTRLISGMHATIRTSGGRWILFDGAPDGKPSLNGTYVNGAAVPTHGRELLDGDTIILAALDPTHPRLDTPGVAAFHFRVECR